MSDGEPGRMTVPPSGPTRSMLPPIDARGGSRCCRSYRSQKTRAGTIMTAQTEAVDFFAFDNSYARLPDRFFARHSPTSVAAPRLVRLNKKLAWHLKLDPGKLAAPEGVEILAGNRVPKKGEPLAMAYAGHQFGTFVPQLGDGRAILLGEVIDRDGGRRGIQLKGSGPTPFSRRGDGRAALAAHDDPVTVVSGRADSQRISSPIAQWRLRRAAGGLLTGNGPP
jgi:hypothetical protein